MLPRLSVMGELLKHRGELTGLLAGTLAALAFHASSTEGTIGVVTTEFIGTLLATALVIDMMGEEAIQKAVLSEDPAFYRGLDELGISVFDMNEAEPADDAATAGPDDAGS